MTIHALHGIHTRPDSRRLLDMCPYIAEGAGVPVVYHEYGDIWAVQTRLKNPGIARRLLPHIKPGDVLLGHSNGNAIWIRALLEGAPAIGMVMLNAALEPAIDIPQQLLWVHSYWNPRDEATPLTEVPLVRRVFFDPLWGDMGRVGYTGTDWRVGINENCGTSKSLPCLAGHGAIIDPANYETWGVEIGRRIASELGEATLPPLAKAA
jgi:hypothetical protein